MRIVAASDTTSERNTLRQTALGLGLDCDAVDLANLPARLRNGPTAVILLGVGLDATAALVATHAAGSITSAPLYIVFDGPETADLPMLLRAGAKGYLRRTELASDLFDVVQELRGSEPLVTKWGQVIAVTGAQPGVGVTTVASNLAFTIAAEQGGSVALAQFSEGPADLAMNLDFALPHSFVELAAAWHRLDGALLTRCMVTCPGGVSVLADEPLATRAAEWSPAGLRQVLVLLRARFNHVVVDLGHTIDAPREAALRLADAVNVVTRLDVPSVRLTKEHITRLIAADVSAEKIVAVVNRYGQEQQLAWKPARETLGLARFDRIADDPGRANEALNAGRLLVQLSATTGVAQDYAALAARWTGGIPIDIRVRIPA